jgi:MCM AAA-lid domain
MRLEETQTEQPHSYTTARTLLSILRLSQALARLRLDDIVTQVSTGCCSAGTRELGALGLESQTGTLELAPQQRARCTRGNCDNPQNPRHLRPLTPNSVLRRATWTRRCG